MKRYSLSTLTFSKRLFIAVLVLFYLLVALFIIYQYHREKKIKTELLHERLQEYNTFVYTHLGSTIPSDSTIHELLSHQTLKNLRTTLIRSDGKVLFDSKVDSLGRMTNHRQRPEIVKALSDGSGHVIHRYSSTLNTPYFFSATYFPDGDYLVRSGLPYTITLKKSLRADRHFIWWILAITLLLTAFFYLFTDRLGESVTRLKTFAMKADQLEPIDSSIVETFPDNELGTISKHIATIYNKLHKTTETLSLEREKLTAHLTVIHEGLAIFDAHKGVIFANTIFLTYLNLISDKNMRDASELFLIPELESILHFLDDHARLHKQEHRYETQIEKNGKIFTVSCVLFHDKSFDITINDVTQREEQARLKRELTQNISHELKTPISSIQGYMETIINNETLSPEVLRKFHERCYAQSKRLTHLLKDISLLTRLDEAAHLIHKERVNVSLIVKDMLLELALQIEEHKVTVINQLKEDLVMRGNPLLIYSIFRNLLDNTLAYGGDGVTVKINCLTEDSLSYSFSFSDNGGGVDEIHLNRLFERFYRVDKGRSRKAGGTGLGLAIVKNAVVSHGGTISAKKRYGGGLEFLFSMMK